MQSVPPSIQSPKISASPTPLRASRMPKEASSPSRKPTQPQDVLSSLTLKLDKRTATGARLTYYASDERYVMSAAGTTPVMITDVQTASPGAVSCRKTTGRTLIFYKTADRIIVDGNEQNRIEMHVEPCATPSAR